jgi:CHAD domain-containing protein
MTNQTTNNICAFGAVVLSKHLSGLGREIEGVRNADDIENIHRMRVASRRIRNGFTIFKRCFPEKQYALWLKYIRRVTKALGASRDLDVQIDLLNKVVREIPEIDTKTGVNLSRKYRPGVQRLLLRLTQKRKEAQSDVKKEMDFLQESGVIGRICIFLQPRLDQYDKSLPYNAKLYQLAYKRISEKIENLFSFELYIHNVERVKELHAMRIVAKQVRYTLEAFAPLYDKDFKKNIQSVQKIQDLLGAIHDCDVWIDYIPHFIEDERQRNLSFFGHARPVNLLLPGFDYFMANRIRERQRLYKTFLSKWDQLLKVDCMWDTLLQTISPPALPRYEEDKKDDAPTILEAPEVPEPSESVPISNNNEDTPTPEIDPKGKNGISTPSQEVLPSDEISE